MTRRVAITGTPGTGKTAVARALSLRGVPVVDLAALAEDCGAVVGRDSRRASRVVDEAVLADAFESVATTLAAPLVVCEGHFAHDMPVDLVVVLRTSPRALERRLRARRWPESKVRENVEAEAMGIVAHEALAALRATEIDTTRRTPRSAARSVLRVAHSRRRLSPPDPGRWDLGDLPWL